MTSQIPATLFADPVPEERLERTAAALKAHGFAVEILDDAAAARARVRELIPEGASVFTSASETTRLSGIEEDINTGGRYEALKPKVLAMDRVTQRRRHPAAARQPRRRRGQRRRGHRDRVPGGRLGQRQPAAPGTPAAPGGRSGHRGAEGGPRPETALRRVEDHALPLENARAQGAYGKPSAVNRLLILNAEPIPGAAPCSCSARPSDSRWERQDLSHPAGD